MEQIAFLVHLTTVFLLIAVVIFTDLLGLLWMLGKRATLSLRMLKILHWLVWLGLAVMIVSGGTLFLTYKEYLLTVPAFFVKMGFIAALIVNAFFIGRHLHIAAERPFASLTRAERIVLLTSGAVSSASWIGAILAARMLGLGL